MSETTTDGARRPLAGRVVLITGGGSGIGRATAELLAASGAAVALTGRRAQPVEEAAAAIEAAGGRALALPGDAASEDDVASAVDAAARWGGDRLDAVVANAALGHVGPAESFALPDWRAMVEVNLTGPFLLARAAIPHLRAAVAGGGGGDVVMIGSELSRAVMPGLGGYCATKWGLLGFTRALAMELRPQRIRVSTVFPGGTLTDFGPDDVAAKAARAAGGERFLAPATVAAGVLHVLTRPAGAWVPELDLLPA